MPTTIQRTLEVIPTSRLNITTGATSQNIEGNTQGAALIAPSLPLNSEVVRLGNSYVATTITAIAPVATFANFLTAGQFLLFNGESQTSGLGKSYVIHRVAFWMATSAATSFVQQLFVHNSTVPVSAIPTITAANAAKSLSGRASQSSSSVGSAGTITANGVWHPAGPSINCGAATATIAMGGDYDVNGLYVVPPGGLFTLAVLSSTAAGTNHLFITWSEVAVALG